jgi:DNA repair exonuclease SbcCD ATPase subunit
MKQGYLFLVLLALSGCSSISPQECQVGDWFAIGKTDGQQGVASTKFRDYQKECAQHGVSSDFNAYQQGHAEGALLYCTYDEGIERGQSGQGYNKVCVGALEPQFRLGYDRGRKWYQAESALRNLQATLEQNAETIYQLEQRIDDNTRQLASSKDKHEKQQLLDENRQLQQDLRQLNQLQGQLRQDLKQAQFQFSLIQQGG